MQIKWLEPTWHTKSILLKYFTGLITGAIHMLDYYNGVLKSSSWPAQPTAICPSYSSVI